MRNVTASLRTADGVAFEGARWSTQTADRSLQESGVIGSDGTFEFLAPSNADVFLNVSTEMVGYSTNGSQSGSRWDSVFCELYDHSFTTQFQEAAVVVSPTRNHVELVTQAAHNVRVLVTDKYARPVRNAQVSIARSVAWMWNGIYCRSGLVVAPAGPYPGAPVGGFGPDQNVDITAVTGFIPGRAGVNSFTNSKGWTLISTPGPLASWNGSAYVPYKGAFVDVTSSLRPGAYQTTTVDASSITGADPQNRVALSVLPFLPLMEEANPEARSSRQSTDVAEPQIVLSQPSGQPIENAAVGVVRVMDGDSENNPRESSVLATARTDADGKARFTGLPTGDYRVIPLTVSSRAVDFHVEAPSQAAPGGGTNATPGGGTNATPGEGTTAGSAGAVTDPGSSGSSGGSTGPIGGTSEMVTAGGSNGTAPSKVRSMKVTTHKNGSARVTWLHPISSNATDYRLRIRKVSGTPVASPWRSTSRRSIKFFALKSGERYVVECQARNAQGRGPTVKVAFSVR